MSFIRIMTLYIMCLHKNVPYTSYTISGITIIFKIWISLENWLVYIKDRKAKIVQSEEDDGSGPTKFDT